MITENRYIISTGFRPHGDDLIRANCPQAGQAGHKQCGWCDKHDLPQFMCMCALNEAERAAELGAHRSNHHE